MGSDGAAVGAEEADPQTERQGDVEQSHGHDKSASCFGWRGREQRVDAVGITQCKLDDGLWHVQGMKVHTF